MTDLGVVLSERYRFVRSLGTGGMGRVWLACDEVLRRDVAIKEVTLPSGLSEDEHEELRRRTLREARAAARLSHPNVVKIYTVESDGERRWIVMEYVRSRSLLQVLEENGALPVDEVARIGLAVLAALGAANEVGVLHRDVKPSNVLIADDGRVVLTDFGSALLDEKAGTITREGLVLGSPHYIAPERARAGISTLESDLWSLGATLYHAVEGHIPYVRTSTMEMLVALTEQEPDPMSRAGPLRPVISGLLEKDPRARISAAEAERRLRQIVAPDRTAAPDESRPHPEARPETATPPRRAGRAGLSRYAPPRLGRRQWLAAGAVAVATLTLGIAAPYADGGLAPWVVGASGPHAPAWIDGDEPSGAAEQPELPAGYRWWYDPSGVRVAFPAGWEVLRETSVVMLFRAPGDPRTLRVRLWDQPGPDLVAALAGEEKRVRLPGYRRIRLQSVPQGDSAEWEYLFDGPTGRMHGFERAVTAAGRAYLLQWQTPLDVWQSNRPRLRVVIENFRPPGH